MADPIQRKLAEVQQKRDDQNIQRALDRSKQKTDRRNGR